MTTHNRDARPAGTTRPGARPRHNHHGDGPVHISEILAHLCGCGGTAIIRYRAGRHGDNYRAIQACASCAPRARAWAARAGPVTETRLAAPDGQADTGDTGTLF